MIVINALCICNIFGFFLPGFTLVNNWFLQVVFTPGQDKCFICGQMGHMAAACEGKAKRKAGEFDEKGDANVAKKPYQVRIRDK